MRPLEILFCCLMVPLFLAWITGIRPAVSGMRMFALLLVAILIAHGILEGMHWQLLPLYVAIFICLFVALKFHSMLQGHLRWIAVAGFFLVGCSLLFSYLLPMFRLPKPTGPYAIGTRILYMVDPSRDAMGEHTQNGRRELMVQIWYPAKPNGEPLTIYRRRREATLLSSYQAVLRTNSYMDAQIDPAQTSYPFLIFNPAWTGQRTQSTFLMQELASHGFIVASIDHTYYSGKVEFPDGRVIDSGLAPELGSFVHATIDEELELGAKYTRIEADDDIFVLDQMQALSEKQGSEWYKRLDMTRVGVLGHSIGGSAAAEAAYLDSRFKAVLNMDGWVFGDAMTQGVPSPYMMIFEKGTEEEPSPEALAKAPESIQRYWQMNREILDNLQTGLQRYGGYELYINGTSHWNFSDKALYSPLRRWSDAGSIDPRRAYKIIDQYVLAFFSNVLNGTQEPLLYGNTKKFPEVQFSSWQHQPVKSN